MKVEERIEIARPPEEVYALVADLECAPEWQPSLLRVDVRRGVEVRRVAGHERESSFEVTRNEAPRLFEIVSRGGPVRATATFELEPVDGGTRVQLALVLELGGALRFAGRMVRGRAGREARENLESSSRAAGLMERDEWDRLFDEIYLRTYAVLERGGHPEAQALAAVELAGAEPGADVLDCPCGYGRHAIPLARAGYRVVGADRSPVLLEAMPASKSSSTSSARSGIAARKAIGRPCRSSAVSCVRAVSSSSRRCTETAWRASTSPAAGSRCPTEACSSRNDASTKWPARSRRTTC